MKKSIITLALSILFVLNLSAQCNWMIDPSGTATFCSGETVTRTGLFQVAGGQYYWIDGITSDTLSVGTSLNCHLTQSRVIHCRYVLNNGSGCDGTYIADFNVTIDIHCTTPVLDQIDTKDVVFSRDFNGYKFITSGGKGTITIMDTRGNFVEEISVNAGVTEYAVRMQDSGLYIAKIMYEGKQKTMKLFF